MRTAAGVFDLLKFGHLCLLTLWEPCHDSMKRDFYLVNGGYSKVEFQSEWSNIFHRFFSFLPLFHHVRWELEIALDERYYYLLIRPSSDCRFGLSL
jgi:hypothetical protein